MENIVTNGNFVGNEKTLPTEIRLMKVLHFTYENSLVIITDPQNKNEFSIDHFHWTIDIVASRTKNPCLKPFFLLFF